MKYVFATCGCKFPAALLAVFMAVTCAVAGSAPPGSDCGAACCQSVIRHGTHGGSGHLPMLRAISCCAGGMDSACDLHDRSDSSDSTPVAAIQPAPQNFGLFPLADPAVRVVTADALLAFTTDAGPMRSAPVPIYLKTRSLLI